MRISDWSSDVCSSDLLGYAPVAIAETLVLAEEKAKSVPFDGAILDCNIGTEKFWPVADYLMGKGVPILFATGGNSDEIPERFADCHSLEKTDTMGNDEIELAEQNGRASCRERVGQYERISVFAVT